jgi:hypothetical protein
VVRDLSSEQGQVRHTAFQPNGFLKNVVFWDVMPCGSCKNRSIGGTYRLYITVTQISELETTLAVTSNAEKKYCVILVFLRSMFRLLATANVVSSSPIFVTLMMKAIRSSDMSVLTRATQRNILEDGIIYSHRHENFKSDIALTCWSL